MSGRSLESTSTASTFSPSKSTWEVRSNEKGVYPPLYSPSRTPLIQTVDAVITPSKSTKTRFPRASAGSLKRRRASSISTRWLIGKPSKACVRIREWGKKTAKTNKKFVRGIQCGVILMLAIMISAAVHAKVFAAQVSAVPETPIPVRYTDVRESAKITFQQDSTQTEEKYYLETMGTGVGWIDYDQDGLMDLFFVQSAATDIYKPPHPLRCALYHNNGDGTFTDVTDKAGVGGEGHYGQGVAVGDFDNDGYPDLYVTGYGRAILYHNNGNGTFTDVTVKAGVADEGPWSTSAGWFDFDKDGWLDLVVTNYLEWTPQNNLWCGERAPGYRSYCSPNDYKGQRTKLYRNNHDGTFTDVSDKSGVGLPESKGMGVVLADFDNDGWPDIAIANDTWPNFLFLNNHDGTFKDVSLISGLAASEDGKYEAGMGIDAADVDGDGWQDIYVTHLDFELNRLYHNNGDGTFNDATYTAGLGQKTVLLSGVAAKFLDYDNDGWEDILQTNGAMLDN